jgi:uncharacterized protein YcbK (DUF882 family)
MNYFTPEGDPLLFDCPCGACHYTASTRLINRLNEAREEAGIPFIITSGPRCPSYNQQIGGATYSEHIDGDGADVACSDSRTRWKIIDAAVKVGFNRIGIAKSFIHLGVSASNDQDVIWLYS